MNHYTRLTEKERYSIENGIRSGKPMREIARQIERPPKTVSKEINRNGGYLGYYAPKAHERSKTSNRKGYSKIDENPELANYIRSKLKEGWSPEVISEKWNAQNEKTTISHESIYTWVYNQKDNLYKTYAPHE
jgi:IS30 family transposase